MQATGRRSRLASTAGRASKRRRRQDEGEEERNSSSSSSSSSSSNNSNANDSNTSNSNTSNNMATNFYPREISNTRARAYIDGTLRRPLQELEDELARTAEERQQMVVGDAVVHWFRADLRTADNRALRAASERAAAGGVPLIGLYVVSPEDWAAHGTAPVRVDFVLRSLAALRTALDRLDVPLWVETVERRGNVAERLAERLGGWGVSHLYANMEYEVDELRRDARVVRRLLESGGVAVELLHDTCVVPPGTVVTGAGKAYSVFTPWFRAWVRQLHEQPALLEASPPPERNPKAAARKRYGQLFECAIPEAPAGSRLGLDDVDDDDDDDDDDDRGGRAERMRSLWPAGEAEAAAKLEAFCTQRLAAYAAERDVPASEATSGLSVHLSSGTLSARTAVRTAQSHNSTARLDGGNEGARSWIREVAWRDFYRHVLVAWPYVCMNKPFKLDMTSLSWSSRPDHFAAWCEGRTGYPIVDAAMRQLRQTGWMHNRCRMVVASFLAKDLRLDWRLGERFFMAHLVDGDLASNNGGWGFAASVGVDPQPYFRIFSPLRQSERFDPQGTYIRTWLPELRHVPDNSRGAIHAPYERGAAAEARAGGYPKPIVEHSKARVQALAMYRGEDV